MQFTVTMDTRSPETGERIEAESDTFTGTLRECVPHVAYGFCRPEWAGTPEPDHWPVRPAALRWLNWPNYREDRRDGLIEERTLHFPASLSPASRARIARLFGLKVRV